jgi:hypothetical protein
MPQFAALASSFPNGVNNCDTWQTMAQSGILDPTFADVWCDDFNTYIAANYTVTTVGTGTVTAVASAVTYGPGGQEILTTSAGIADALYQQLVNATYLLNGSTPASPHQLFFKAKFLLTDALNCNFYCGLMAISATPLSGTVDGVYIVKVSGQYNFTLQVVSGGVVLASVPLPTACVAANNTFCELGIYVDLNQNVAAFWNPTTGNQPRPSAYQASGPDGRVASYIPSLGTLLSPQAVAPSIGIQNSTAAARSLVVDFLVATYER